VDRDLDAIGQVRGRLVEHDVPAGDEKQPAVALEEEAAGRGEKVRAEERRDARRGEQDRFDHV
jgi:hypothetical protein